MYLYNPVVDAAVVLMCICSAIALNKENFKNEKTIPTFTSVLIKYAILGCVSIVYGMSLRQEFLSNVTFRVFRFLYYTGYVSCIYALVGFVKTLTALNEKERNDLNIIYMIGACAFELMYIITEFVNPDKVNPVAYVNVTEPTIPDVRLNMLQIYYAFAMGGLFLITLTYKNKMASDTRIKMLLMEILSITIFIFDTFVLKDMTGLLLSISVPIFGTLLSVYANPCNYENGAFDYVSAENYISKLIKKKDAASFKLICLSMVQNTAQSYDEEHFSKNIESAFYLLSQNESNGKLFQLKENRFVYIYTDNSMGREKLRDIIENKLCCILRNKQIDYRIFVISSKKDFTLAKQYLTFIKYCEMECGLNVITHIDEQLYTSYMNTEYVKAQLENIHKKNDINNEQVQVFCQPVYNVETEKYDTAEALMRLSTEKLGMLTPDQFIKLAEDNGYIHTLSLCILNKTCKEVRTLLDEGYCFSRITVNMCIAEINGPQVAEEIKNILVTNGVPPSYIAIELTESCDDTQTDITEYVIRTIKEKGMKVYLDDFGTGYSNFDRIIKLPFDVVKFDRAFLTLQVKDEVKKFKIIEDIANIFKNLGYDILFEGVETEEDEQICTKMGAKYLQGFFYSKPIPICGLRKFFKKNKMEE